MTNEQRAAIELAKEFTKMDFSNPMGWTGYYDAELEELSQAIDTVLNLIKEQQGKLEKKDEQIDLMAEHISKQDIDEDICIKNITNPDWCNEDYTNCKDCIKQYFADKAKMSQ